MTAGLLPLAAPLSLFFLFLSSLSLSFLALLVPIYRQEWCHQLQLFFNNGGYQTLTFDRLHMVGAAPPLTAAFVNGRCRPLMVVAQ